MRVTSKRILIALFLLAFISVGIASSSYLKSRFILAIDPQLVTCLNGHVFVVDKTKTTPQIGEIFAFSAPDGVAPVYEPGTRMIKRIVAGPGDDVRIANDETIYVNDSPITKGLWHLYMVDPVVKKRFFGQTTLKDGEWWFVGDSSWSFDSRYWGIVKSENIIGKAYVIF